MDSQGAASAIEQHLKIAAGLCRFDHAECIFLTGNLEIEGVVRCDLEKYAVVCSALVRLAGRVQKTRAEAEAGCRACASQNIFADRIKQIRILGIPFDVGEQAEIVVRDDVRDVGIEK